MKSFVTSSRSRRSARGFSLIELLVGIVIGLVGLLAIFKIVGIWDSHTRSTVAGGDADVAGTLAMFMLERDIKQAGAGFGTAPANAFNCNGVGFHVNDALTGTSRDLPFYPIQIVADATGAPDRINVLYGNSSFFTSTQTYGVSTATTKTITLNQYTFKPGDLAVVAGTVSQPCSLVEITTAPTTGGVITHAPGNYAAYYSNAAASNPAARFNGAAGTLTAYGSGTIYNLGPAPQYNGWSIAGNRVLRRSEQIFNAATGPIDVAEGVINMKAQYGIDANGDSVIADSEWTTTPPTAANWPRLLAVRVALLVRSGQWERSADGSASGVPTGVTTSAPQPSWAGTSVCVPTDSCNFGMTNVDGSPDTFSATDSNPNNWRYYRYRVYERVIPLRNMIWGNWQ